MSTKCCQWQASFISGYLAVVSTTEQILQKFPKSRKACMGPWTCAVHGRLTNMFKVFVTELYYLGNILNKWFSHYQANSEEVYKSAIHYMILVYFWKKLKLQFCLLITVSQQPRSCCEASSAGVLHSMLYQSEVHFTVTTILQSSSTSCRPLLIVTHTLITFPFLF